MCCKRDVDWLYLFKKCVGVVFVRLCSSSSGKNPVSFSCLYAKDLLCLRIFFFLFLKGKEPLINNHTIFSRK